MKKENIKITYLIIISVVIFLGLSISLQSIFAAWQAPGSAPPNGNVFPPIFNEGIPSAPLINSPLGVSGDLLVGANSFFVDESNDFVGIGTTSPIKLFHIEGGNPQVFFNDTSGGVYWGMGSQGGAFQIYSATSNGSFNKRYFYIGASGTEYNPSQIDLDFIIHGNGAEVMRIDALKKRVGVGTPAPLASLSVQGTVGEPIMNIASSTGESVFYISKNDKVGIGTDTPEKPIHVQDLGGYFMWSGYGQSQSSFINALNGNQFELIRGRGTRENPTAVINNTKLFNYDVYAQYGTGENNVVQKANFGAQMVDVSPPASSDWISKIYFATADIMSFEPKAGGWTIFNPGLFDVDTIFNGDTSEVMRIDASTDRVGIGTTDPDAKLEIAGDIKITGGAGNIGDVLTTTDVEGLATWATPSSGASISGTDNYIPRFDSTTNLVDSGIYQKNTGEVGIGTTLPGVKLEVNGGAHIGSDRNSNALVSSFSFHDPQGGALTYTQLVEEGWSGGHALLWNAYKANGFPAGPLETPGKLKYANNEGANKGVSGMIQFDANGGNMYFRISPDETKTIQNNNVEWGTPVMTLFRDGTATIGGGSVDGALKLDVEGQVGATEYCDNLGADCFAAADIGGGAEVDTLDTVAERGATTDVSIITGGLSLNGAGNEGDVTNIDKLIGYNDLFVNGNSAGTVPIYYGASEHKFYIDGDATEKVIIDNSGNVGIGINAPEGNLHTSSLGATPKLVLERNGTNQWNFILSSMYGGATDGALNIVAADSAADFGIRTSSTSGDVDFIIKSDGNVGIGTTSPQRNLHIVEDVSNAVIRLDGTGTGYVSFDFARSGTNKWGFGMKLWDGGLAYWDAEAGNAVRFYIENGTGNIGIGTTNPSTKLNLYDDSSGPIVDLQGATTQYTGVKIADTNNIEQWFMGSNDSNNFVLRRTVATIAYDDLSIDSNGDITTLGNITTTAGDVCIQGGNCLSDGGSSNWDLNGTDIFNNNTGNVGIGINPPTNKLHVVNTENTEAVLFLQTNILTGQKDVFTIQDEDVGGGSQDESSSFKVIRTGDISDFDDGTSLVELTYTGINNDDDEHFYILGRLVDEGQVKWGVDLLDADIWTEGSIRGGATGVDCAGTDAPCFNSPTFAIEESGNSYINGGNVGIGTTNPTSQLHLYKNDASGNNAEIALESGIYNKWSIYNNGNTGSGDDGSLRFWNSAITGEKNALTILNNGNVGIGTTTPRSKLSIAGGDLEIKNGGTQSHISLFSSDTQAKNQWVITNEGNANRLRFLAQNDEYGGGAAYRMVIMGQSGNVGIGTPSPEKLLHLYKKSDSENAEININSKYADDSGPSKWSIYQEKSGLGDLRFWKDDDLIPTNSDNILTIKGDGSVGIGTTGPTSELDVIGEITANTNAVNIDPTFIYKENDTERARTYFDTDGLGASDFYDAWTVDVAGNTLRFNQSGYLLVGRDWNQLGGHEFDKGIRIVTDSSTGLWLMSYSDTISQTPMMNRYRARGTEASPAGLENDNTVNKDGYYGYNTNNGDFVNGWSVNHYIDCTEGVTCTGGIPYLDEMPMKMSIYTNDAAWTEKWTFKSKGDFLVNEGSVGIGIGNPGAYKLNVSGSVYVLNDLTIDGQLNVSGADLAEEFSTDGYVEAGTVMVMGEDWYKSSRPCDSEYDTKAIGVVSDNASVVMGRIESENKAIIALTGVVKVKVVNNNGIIKKGDLLTTSSILGHAMKATEPKIGTIIGKSLEDFNGSQGEIMAFINLQ